MHFETSMSFATSVWRRAGGVTLDADRRIKSCVPNRCAWGPVEGFGIGGNIVFPPLRHRLADGLDIDQERLVFRRLDVGVPDKRRQRIGSEAFLRRTGEAPMQWNADDMDGLPIADERPYALRHHGLRPHRAAFRPD